MKYHPHTNKHEHESHLSTLRIARGLTYAKLSELTGVSTQHLACLSTGTFSPIDRWGHLTRNAELVCLVLEATPEELFPRYFCDLNSRTDGVALENTYPLWLYSDDTAQHLTEPADKAVERRQEVNDILGRAKKPRDRAILALRLQGWTLDEIGKDMGLTRERVRQIESKTFKGVRR